MSDGRPPSPPQAQLVADYLEVVVRPLVEARYQGDVIIEHRHGAFEGEHVFRVFIPRPVFPLVLGKQGANADAIRMLARVRARCLGWQSRIDVRLLELEPLRT